MTHCECYVLMQFQLQFMFHDIDCNCNCNCARNNYNSLLNWTRSSQQFWPASRSTAAASRSKWTTSSYYRQAKVSNDLRLDYEFRTAKGKLGSPIHPTEANNGLLGNQVCL